MMPISPFVPEKSNWIWTPNFDDAASKGQFVLFRRTFELEEKPSSEVTLHVSADTRYRLYLNGESIGFGPAKSYLSRWYYDTFNIAAHLKQGSNVLVARVLRFSSTHDGCFSMIRSPFPGFILSCEVGVRLSITSSSSCSRVFTDCASRVSTSAPTAYGRHTRTQRQVWSPTTNGTID